MKRVYGGTQQLRKERRLGKCERISSRIQRKDKHKSKKTGETRYGGRKGL